MFILDLYTSPCCPHRKGLKCATLTRALNDRGAVRRSEKIYITRLLFVWWGFFWPCDLPSTDTVRDQDFITGAPSCPLSS